MSSPTDDDLDRLLSDGGVSGARRDKLFDAIIDASEASNGADTAPSPTAFEKWWKKLWRPLAIATPVAAALAIGIVLADRAPSELRAKGDAPVNESQAPLLLASCGAQDTPCAVGEPLFLRLQSPVDVERVEVVVVGAHQKTMIASLPNLNANQEQPLEVKITPEESDAANGLTFEVRDRQGVVLSTLNVHVAKDKP